MILRYVVTLGLSQSLTLSQNRWSHIPLDSSRSILSNFPFLAQSELWSSSYGRNTGLFISTGICQI